MRHRGGGTIETWETADDVIAAVARLPRRRPPRQYAAGLLTRPCAPAIVQYSISSRADAQEYTSMKTADADDLDAIDRRILAEFQARRPHDQRRARPAAPASHAPCLRRVRRLEEAGIIRGYHADTDAGRRWAGRSPSLAIVGLESQKEAVPVRLRDASSPAGREVRRVPHDPRRRRLPDQAGGARHGARQTSSPRA
jgi:hypothetical protein